MIGNIQLLRAIAATMVVGHHIIDAIEHYIGGGRYTIGVDTLASGVDLFFVISGFIMAATTLDRPPSPWRFLRQRLLRVVPLYALFTGLAVLCLLAGLKLFGRTSLSALDVVHALLFIPSFDAGGKAQDPIVFVGWSLQYEMAFYLLVALLLPLRGVALRTGVLVLGLVALVLLGQDSAAPLLRYYASPLVLEFAAGYALCVLLRRWAPSTTLAVAALCAGVWMLAATVPLGEMRGMRAWYYGVPAVLIVAGAVTLSRRGLDSQHPAGLALGDASYALYLVHPFVIQVLGKIANQMAWSATLPGIAFWSTAILFASIAAGVWVHRRVERPMQRRWGGRRADAGAPVHDDGCRLRAGQAPARHAQ